LQAGRRLRGGGRAGAIRSDRAVATRHGTRFTSHTDLCGHFENFGQAFGEVVHGRREKGARVHVLYPDRDAASQHLIVYCRDAHGALRCGRVQAICKQTIG